MHSTPASSCLPATGGKPAHVGCVRKRGDKRVSHAGEGELRRPELAIASTCIITGEI